jgi:hypothetical protein
VAQSVSAPNGPLMAARELLRNPPGEAASPDAQRQWRDNVDRLLNLSQASPCSAGGSISRQRRRQGGASGSVHSPSVRSARTEDLRAELNRRRAGEDARVSIERRVGAGSTSRVVTSMPNLLRQHRRCRDLSRHRCPGWAAQRSQTTFARSPSRPSFGRTCRKSMMGPPTRQSSSRSTSPLLQRLEVTTQSWQVTFM